MKNYIIIDIETPYSFKPEAGINELAAIVIQNNQLIDTLHLAVITDQAEYTKGYGAGLEPIHQNESLKNSFQEFLKKYPYPLVAHNASFERSFLKYWNWIDINFDNIYCSMRAIRHSYKLDNYRMETLLKHFNITNQQQHTAIQDVLDLFEILKIVNPTDWAKLGSSSPSSSHHSDKKYDAAFEKLQREAAKERLSQAKDHVERNIFDGKKIVFTGTMMHDRITMMETAIKYGAKTCNSVSSKIDLLVVGQDAGNKLKKALELDIKIISEDEFINLIAQH